MNELSPESDTSGSPASRAPSPRSAAPIPPRRKPLVVVLVLSALAVALGVFVTLRSSSRGLGLTEPLKRTERVLAKKQKQAALKDLKRNCERHDCRCALELASRALEADSGEDALLVIERARQCEQADALDGFQAEAWVRSGKDGEGVRKATRVLLRAENDASATYALALAHYRKGSFVEARDLASRAKRRRRGPTADLLLGLSAYHAGDLDGAARAFREVLAVEPNDVDANFNLGLVAQKQNRYGEARTSYLRAARGDPEHLGARYNLALLAHSIGATAEAQHHLAQYEKLAPNSAQLGELRAALAKAPANPPTHTFTLGQPVSNAALPNAPPSAAPSPSATSP